MSSLGRRLVSALGRISGDPRVTIAKRDVSSLGREKTIVLALLIQLFVAAFSSFLVVGLTSLYDPAAIANEGVDVGITGEASDELVAAARETRGTVPFDFESREAAMDRFHRGDLDAVLEAEYLPQEGGGRGIQVGAVAPGGTFQTTFVVVQLRRVLSTLERTERIERRASLDFDTLPLPDPVDASPYFGFTYTILVPLLLFLPPFISGSVAVDVLTEEMERGTLELLRVAPVSLLDVVEGKAIGMILIAPLQAGLWLGLLALNDIAVSNVIPLLVLVTAMATVVTVLGLSLGLLTGDRRQAQLLYSVLALLVFGATIALPEHPATTVAKLAVDSPTATTFFHVAGFAAVAVGASVLVRAVVGRVDPERF
ncbi:MAG: ABC transporter permease [Haloarculaceae archaeon]